jgi:hypothetical protein
MGPLGCFGKLEPEDDTLGRQYRVRERRRLGPEFPLELVLVLVFELVLGLGLACRLVHAPILGVLDFGLMSGAIFGLVCGIAFAVAFWVDFKVMSELRKDASDSPGK